jgi:hypothetical protein
VSAARAVLTIISLLLRACSIAPGFLAAPGRRLDFPVSDKVRGVERREALPLSYALRRRVPCDRDARLPALHVRHFSVPGRAFRGIFAPISQAPGGGIVVSPGRSPGSPQGRVTSPARRSRIPPRLRNVSRRRPRVNGTGQ